jgi:hypothetical protein
MTFRSGIFGFAIASAAAFAAESANADDNGAQWTGFYGGVNAGLERSNDPKDNSSFDDKNSYTGSSRYPGTGSELPGTQAGNNILGRDPFVAGLENEIYKALPSEKAK